MAEQLPVKQQVESSSLSSSAISEYTKAGGLGPAINRVYDGVVSSNLTAHTKERVRLVEEAVLKTVGSYQAQGFDSLPLRLDGNKHKWRAGRVVWHRLAKLRLG